MNRRRNDHWSRRQIGWTLLTAVSSMLAASLSFAGTGAAATTGYTASFIPAGPNLQWVAVNPVTDMIYLTTAFSNQVTVINGATGAVATTITLGEPGLGVAVDPVTNTVYVAERSAVNVSAVIAVIDGRTNTVTTTIAEPSTAEPVGIAVDSATNTVYVVNSSAVASVVVMSGATNKITATIPVAAHTIPHGVAVDESTDIIWVTEGSGAVISISGVTNKITSTVALGRAGTELVAVDPVTNTVYVTEAGGRDVAVIDGSTSTLITRIPVGPSVFGIATDPGTNTIYATSPASDTTFGTTWVIDGTGNVITDTLPRGGLDMAVDTATGRAYEAGWNRQNGAVVIARSATDAWFPICTNPLGDPIFHTGKVGTVTITADARPAATFSETGALPAGVTFSSDGTLAGTPAADAGGSYIIRITASNGVAPDSTQVFVLTVDQPGVITSPASATFKVGTGSSQTLTATGYPPIVGFSVLGSLPSGVDLTITPSSVLAGDPAVGTGGVYRLTLEGWDPGEVVEATQAFTLTVLESPSFTSAPKATFRAGAAGRFAVHSHGYPAPLFTEKGRLPAGVSLSKTGLLAGKPGPHAGGSYPVTITARNGIARAATQAFTLTVDQSPAFISARHTTFRIGTRNTFTFRTTGFPAARLTQRGRLPMGVRFIAHSAGAAVLTGDPPRADRGRTFTITVIAANRAGPAVRETFKLRIA